MNNIDVLGTIIQGDLPVFDFFGKGPLSIKYWISPGICKSPWMSDIETKSENSNSIQAIRLAQLSGALYGAVRVSGCTVEEFEQAFKYTGVVNEP